MARQEGVPRYRETLGLILKYTLTAMAGPFIAFIFFLVSVPFWIVALFFMNSPGASDALGHVFMIDVIVLLVAAVVISAILMIAARDRS